MNGWGVAQPIIVAVALAIIFGIAKLFQRMNTLETRTEPLIEWWKKTSLDALKIATNPTDKRLAELGQKYTDNVQGKGRMTLDEKRELIEGLKGLLADTDTYKRQSASLSLRFIEAREGLKLINQGERDQ